MGVSKWSDMKLAGQTKTVFSMNVPMGPSVLDQASHLLYIRKQNTLAFTRRYCMQVQTKIITAQD